MLQSKNWCLPEFQVLLHPSPSIRHFSFPQMNPLEVLA
jgi:hypothetical protein